MQFAVLILLLAVFWSAPISGEDLRANFGTTVVIPSGFRGRIYYVRKYTSHLPDFESKKFAKRKPAGIIYASSLNIPSQDFRQGFPGVTDRFEWFAIDYTGKFWIERPGTYRFLLTSDDGARLFIDGEMVVDNDGVHPPQDRTGNAELSGGIHQIRVDYFQGPRFGVALILKIAPPGEPFRVFSTDEFKPPADPETWHFSGNSGPPSSESRQRP